LPVKATPFYDVTISNPQDELPHLAERYPEAETALTRLQITYRPGEDNLPEIFTALDRIFPRWYQRTYQAAIADSPEAVLDDLFPIDETGESTPALEPEGVVLQYVQRMLAADDEDREELISLAQELFEKE
ncbi:MAG: hypothetical protein KDA84_21315, partial [Planctomycetaceae bacterium]|nr:hypothetical protein [Planctomycetaceae bacterium]